MDYVQGGGAVWRIKSRCGRSGARQAYNGSGPDKNEQGMADSPGRNLDTVFPAVYEDLRRIARLQRARHGSPLPLGTSTIVHEAYLKLQRSGGPDYPDGDQFMYLAAATMRSVIVDNARHWLRRKRGGDARTVSADEIDLVSIEHGEEILALEDALDALGEFNARVARVVVCRFFGGLNIDETARALSISAATVKRDWQMARSWLYCRMNVAPAS